MRPAWQAFDAPVTDPSAPINKLGYVARLMQESPTHMGFPIAYFKRIIEPAIRHKMIKIYFSTGGAPIGYVVWACVDHAAEQRFFNTGRWDLHESEWNDGPNWWIIDMLVPKGHIKAVLKDVRDVVFQDLESVRYFRIKQGKAISREISRSSNSSFLKARG